jgi:aryl-alcohol dehydrogenase-like predicted oxidoreductase
LEGQEPRSLRARFSAGVVVKLVCYDAGRGGGAPEDEESRRVAKSEGGSQRAGAAVRDVMCQEHLGQGQARVCRQELPEPIDSAPGALNCVRRIAEPLEALIPQRDRARFCGDDSRSPVLPAAVHSSSIARCDTVTAMLSGCATAEGTAAFAAAHRSRHSADFYGGVCDWTTSSLGLGTYLGPPDADTDSGYQAALRTFVEQGVNLVDTAVNYRAQASERALGAVLRELIEGGSLTREQIVVATKGGFNPRDNDSPERGGATLLKGIPPEEVVQGMHCIHPRYLERMLARSRDNLGLETLDVYYLHNPETQLPAVAKPIFYERIRRAFAALESARERGELSVYGVATWGGLRLEEGDPAALDLERLVGAARSVAGDTHGFRLVQLPFSLALPEALTCAGQKVNDELLPALEAARRLGLDVVTSGPLAQARLLAEPLPTGSAALGPSEWTSAQRALHFARSGGAGCTLVGTSRADHARENLVVASVPRASASALRATLGT